jgi:putative transposase
LARSSRPEIVNSDQGCPFACKNYVQHLKDDTISMDGKERALDSIYIENFWPAIKYQHLDLNPAGDGIILFQKASR